MIIRKDRLLASFAFFGPFTIFFYGLLGSVTWFYPSEKLVASYMGVIDWFLLSLVFMFVVLLTSISFKKNNYPRFSFKRIHVSQKINSFDLSIIILLSILHFKLNFSSDVSVRHLDEGISEVGMLAYLYYFLKPTFALILIKYTHAQKPLSVYLALLLCLSMFFMPSSALDVYFVFAFFIIISSKKAGRVNTALISFLTLIFLFVVVYAGISVKNSVSDLAEGALISELSYRAAVFPVALSYHLSNFFSISSIELLEMYWSVNEYRILTLLQINVEKLDAESLNRLNFILTNLWDRPNQPGASPGIWASLYISPLLFALSLPVYSLTIKYIYRVFVSSGVQNWGILIGVISPLFYSILVSPFDFIFMLGGGWLFIFYISIPAFSRLLRIPSNLNIKSVN